MAKRSKRTTGPDERLNTGCPAAEWIGWHMFDVELVETVRVDMFTEVSTCADVCRNCGHVVLSVRERRTGLEFYVSEDTEVVILDPDE